VPSKRRAAPPRAQFLPARILCPGCAFPAFFDPRGIGPVGEPPEAITASSRDVLGTRIGEPIAACPY